MDRNKISLILCAAITIIIVAGTIIKVYKNHEDSLLRVTEQRIEEAARKCVLDSTCQENKTTLEFLIQNGYLDEQVHPISKEYIDTSLEIECIDYVCTTKID